MTKAYQRLANETGAIVAPAGTAFESLIKEYPDIEIFSEDGEHASPAGSYLIACIFYSLISKRSPFGLPGRVVHNGNLICDIENETAKVLQSTAWKAVNM